MMRAPIKQRIVRKRWLRELVREKSSGFCAECGRYDAKGESDHILPLFLGGPDVAENLQWLCRACHKRKSLGEIPLRAKADRVRSKHELTKRRKPVALLAREDSNRG